MGGDAEAPSTHHVLENGGDVLPEAQEEAPPEVAIAAPALAPVPNVVASTTPLEARFRKGTQEKASVLSRPRERKGRLTDGTPAVHSSEAKGSEAQNFHQKGSIRKERGVGGEVDGREHYWASSSCPRHGVPRSLDGIQFET